MTALRWTHGILLASALGLAGCGSSVHVGGDDAGTGGDGGSGESCGPTTCAAGTVCCNASCGVCVSPGEACTTIACVDAGPGGGGCVSCAAPPDGCRYEGGSCATCGTLVCDSCGPGLPVTCAPGQFCDNPNCGDDGVAGMCVPTPDACPAVEDPACGCDGRTYGNGCEANANGVSVRHPGPCGPGTPCDPMDAAGEGFCDLFLGYAWDGRACIGMSGCSCRGADCGSLYMDPSSCEAAYSGCSGSGVECGGFGGIMCPAGEWCDYIGGGCGFADGGGYCRTNPTSCIEIFSPVCGCDGVTYDNDCIANGAGQDILHTGACRGGGGGSCAPQDARGVGPCAAFFGYAWDGSSCVGLSGCSCAGTDCGSLYMTPEDCVRAYAMCPPAPPPAP